MSGGSRTGVVKINAMCVEENRMKKLAVTLLTADLCASLYSGVARAAPKGKICAASEEKARDEQEAAAGADTSNPTAAVNFQDIRHRYFDLAGSADKHGFETESA